MRGRYISKQLLCSLCTDLKDFNIIKGQAWKQELIGYKKITESMVVLWHVIIFLVPVVADLSLTQLMGKRADGLALTTTLSSSLVTPVCPLRCSGYTTDRLFGQVAELINVSLNSGICFHSYLVLK